MNPRISYFTNHYKNPIMSKAIQQWGNLAALVDCLHTKDWAGLKTCLQDVLVEPVRREFIPEFYALKELAQAIGFGISGSGPSMFSLYAQKEEALKRGQAMQKHLYAKGIQSQMYLGRMKNQGARII